MQRGKVKGVALQQHCTLFEKLYFSLIRFWHQSNLLVPWAFTQNFSSVALLSTELKAWKNRKNIQCFNILRAEMSKHGCFLAFLNRILNQRKSVVFRTLWGIGWNRSGMDTFDGSSHPALWVGLTFASPRQEGVANPTEQRTSWPNEARFARPSNAIGDDGEAREDLEKSAAKPLRLRTTDYGFLNSSEFN